MRFELLDERSELTSVCDGRRIQQERCACLRTFLILADWKLAAIADDTMPPRDPNDDDDEEEEEEEEEDEERDDRPPVVREPESDE